ncbi:unnamed protein product, partial [Darwinula stevensoni]
MFSVLRGENCQKVSRIVTRHVRCYQSKTEVYGCKPKKDYLSTLAIPESLVKAKQQNPHVWLLINAYRNHGHSYALLDPLGLDRSEKKVSQVLDPSYYGLKSGEVYDVGGLLCMDKPQADIDEILSHLKSVYCGSTALEIGHIQHEEMRQWICDRWEQLSGESFTNEEKISLAVELLKSQAFDIFVANKFTTVKRYSGEGAESMFAFFLEIFAKANQYGRQRVVLAMPHRGRLNLLTGMLHFPPVIMFQKMKGMAEFPPDVKTTGDVLSHLTSSVDLEIHGKPLHVTMLPNPSHLEAVNPVAMGKTRAFQQAFLEGDYSNDGGARPGDQTLCIQVHGDAALPGQGVIQESLCLTSLPHFDIGGSLHLVVNNQVGFTTPSDRGRSTLYCTDVAKMIEVPVLHVNGDHPEEVLRATRLACEFQEKFRKDVFLDLVCFRRWGHNELDDPTMTNPIMYSVINTRKTVPDMYADKVLNEGIVTREELMKPVDAHIQMLNENFKKVDSRKPKAPHLKGLWTGMEQAGTQLTGWETGVDTSLLHYIGLKSVTHPEDFNLHVNVKKAHIEARRRKLNEGEAVDWATAEALAFGSLLYQGFHVRLCGQDCGRGTFSQRHAMLVHQGSGDIHIPLNHMMDGQTGFFEAKEAVLGFEYGFSMTHPNCLVLWEAQFGDFFNTAQVVIDTFISSGESKWLMQSGLVMLLPHGLDGAGPEHSSCRLERFLQLSDSYEEAGMDGDNVNMQIVHPTTPAQYFHLLRRQMVRNFRKPLIIAAPKILLRLPAATSHLEEMGPGTSFHPVLGEDLLPLHASCHFIYSKELGRLGPLTDDPIMREKPAEVKHIVFCCGKHYYALVKERETRGIKNVAIVRVESLSPFPAPHLQAILSFYKNAQSKFTRKFLSPACCSASREALINILMIEFTWSQEEHRNAGPWTFVSPRFANLVGC